MQLRQVFINLISCADLTASVIFYAGFFVVAALLSMYLYFFSVRPSMFIFCFFDVFLKIRWLICALFMVLMSISSCGDIALDWLKHNLHHSDLKLCIERFLIGANCFLSKVPDELEMVHR